ncbi:MAG TPA: minor capsid protein [Candidatus Gallacutalibacter stercoravium]|nr:minor capsid protein [Candidatus Gallacutalibacter stercoravium]
MYVKKICGYVVITDVPSALTKDRSDFYAPPTQESRNYKNWVTILDLKTCLECRSRHGQIYQIDEIPAVEPPLHPNCRCRIQPMKAVKAGQATKDGQNGADFWMKYFADLPEYYITRNDLMSLGWREGKSPAKFAPGKMATMGIYRNDDNHLPQIPGRVWYEADINYYSGRRNGHRLLWSNDGLLFVTYDHYETFLEVI